MTSYKKMCVITAAGAVAAFLLRLLQQFTGFENATGLAIPAHPAALALAVVLAVTAVGLVLVSRGGCGGKELRPFTECFSVVSAGNLTLVVMGIFLMAAGGVLQMMFALMGGGLQNVVYDGGMIGMVWMGNVSPREVLILGGCAAASAVCLFPAVVVCRREDESVFALYGELLLIPVICTVVRLVLIYRINSIDPVLQAYYVELLAVVFVALAFYQLAGFAFGQGSLRWYSICSGLAVVLCAATLADGHSIAETAFYAGCMLTLAGFRLMYYVAAEEA